MARRCPWYLKKIKYKKIILKISIFFYSVRYPQGTHEFPQKMKANPVQPFGQRANIYTP